MTEHKQAAKTFAVLLVFFTVVILVFFYTAQKNIPHVKQEEPVKTTKAVRVPIAWTALTALTDESNVTVVVGGVSVSAEVARSDAKKALGLSHRDPLKEGEGMLFIFDRASTLSFWNKDMRFPIDVVWMNNGAAIGVSENLPVFEEGGTPTIITSPFEAQAALEVSSGFAKQHAVANNSNVTIYENK